MNRIRIAQPCCMLRILATRLTPHLAVSPTRGLNLWPPWSDECEASIKTARPAELNSSVISHMKTCSFLPVMTSHTQFVYFDLLPPKGTVAWEFLKWKLKTFGFLEESQWTDQWECSVQTHYTFSGKPDGSSIIISEYRLWIGIWIQSDNFKFQTNFYISI